MSGKQFTEFSRCLCEFRSAKSPIESSNTRYRRQTSQPDDADKALKHLRLATQLLPTDPDTWYNLGITLEESGELDDADEAYEKVIRLIPTSSIAARAEAGRSRITEISFRNRGGDLRPDALSYCLGALQRFDGKAKPEIQGITFEIAMLGSRGLKVNDPAQQYTLRSIPGKFSGRHLLRIEYVGFKLIEPSVDLGFYLSAEYEEACKIHGK